MHCQQRHAITENKARDTQADTMMARHVSSCVTELRILYCHCNLRNNNNNLL